jgi:DNA-binding response OmpR family regulator
MLLVDSDTDLNNANQCIFYPQGYTVLTATSIACARVILRETEPDIIMMETNLPDGNGFDFCKGLYGKTAASIIFLTSRTGGENMAKGIRLGAVDYIEKPVDKDIIIARVEAIMRCRRERRSVRQK